MLSMVERPTNVQNFARILCVNGVEMGGGGEREREREGEREGEREREREGGGEEE